MTSLPEEEAVAVAGSWLEAAEEELEAVEDLLRDDSFVPRHVCVLANAAARKALTALLSVARTPFSRRHDLDALLRMLPLHSLVRRDVPDLHDLAQWAAEPRFPGDWQEASVEDARRAARQARDVFEAVLSDLVEQGTRIGTPRA